MFSVGAVLLCCFETVQTPVLKIIYQTDVKFNFPDQTDGSD